MWQILVIDISLAVLLGIIIVIIVIIIDHTLARIVSNHKHKQQLSKKTKGISLWYNWKTKKETKLLKNTEQQGRNFKSSL